MFFWEVRKQESAISRVLSTTIIHLGQSSPTASSNLPGSPLGTGGADKPHTPLFGLAPGGVYRAANCYQSRGALLPHHFTLTAKVLKTMAGGIFSVALSMGSHPPGVTWRLVRRSPDFPLQGQSTHSDCLANSCSLGRGFYSKRKGSAPWALRSFSAWITPIVACKEHYASHRLREQRPWQLPCPATYRQAPPTGDRYRRTTMPQFSNQL